MIYDVRQKTTYTYASPVVAARHVLRLMPIDRPGQRVIAADLAIEPAPAERDESTDFFGNLTTRVALRAPHDALVVRTTATIEITAAPSPDPAATPPWESVRELAAASVDPAPGSPAHHLFPTRHVPIEPMILAYGALSFAPGRPILAGAADLARRIRADFVYDTKATEVTTPIARAFAMRRGVCQDFTQIMIAALRGLGLPAGYVSGYLRTIPPPGRPRLEGADATHAWVSVWCGPKLGWVGVDPTNAMLAGQDHIVLAVGRDYGDVAPIDGVIVAVGQHKLAVEVDVVPRS